MAYYALAAHDDDDAGISPFKRETCWFRAAVDARRFAVSFIFGISQRRLSDARMQTITCGLAARRANSDEWHIARSSWVR